MISFIVSFIVIFILINLLSRKADRENERIRQERAVEGNFRPENASKYVGSILTGIPVQTRYGDGGLTGAGAQELQWCNGILEDMGKKRKSMLVNTLYGKVKMTREQVEKYRDSI